MLFQWWLGDTLALALVSFAAGSTLPFLPPVLVRAGFSIGIARGPAEL
jgi:hypothetical protein